MQSDNQENIFLRKADKIKKQSIGKETIPLADKTNFLKDYYNIQPVIN